MQTKLSHLDIVGRPVVALRKTNAVPEHNQHFQVGISYLSDAHCNYEYENFMFVLNPCLMAVKHYVILSPWKK